LLKAKYNFFWWMMAYLNFSNQAKVCATLVIKLLGLAAMP
jgi:hypothetical protein